MRLAGASLPGLYIGLFKVKDLGRAMLFLSRLERAILVEAEGKRLLFSPARPGEILGLLRGVMGKGLTGAPRVKDKGTRAAALSLLLILAMLAASLHIYASLPNRVPVHYGWGFKPDRWGSKTELLVASIVIYGSAALINILCIALSRSTPGLGYLLSPVSIGLGILGLGMLTSTLCFT